jgi:hypothetical protein
MKDGLAAVLLPARPRAERPGAVRRPLRREAGHVQHLGIDRGTRRAAWCALDERGEVAEGAIPAERMARRDWCIVSVRAWAAAWS